jgi:hypothetical protein
MGFCKWPDGCENYCEGFTDFCGSHNAQMRKEAKNAMKPKKVPGKIAQKSEKTIKSDREYSKEKAVFIVGKVCPVYPELKVEDIHHKKGRDGYADQWARDNGITLKMDKRFWLAVSRKGHIWIGLNPVKAIEKGYSLPRGAIFSLEN